MKGTRHSYTSGDNNSTDNQERGRADIACFGHTLPPPRHVDTRVITCNSLQLLFGLSCRSLFSVLPSAELPSLLPPQGPRSGLLTVDSLLTLPHPQSPPTPLSIPVLVLSLSPQAHTTITRSPPKEQMRQQWQNLPSSLQRPLPSSLLQRRTTKRHGTITRHHTNQHPNKSSTGVQQDCRYHR